MKKSKFVKATFILLIGGIVTKILGMIIRIVITRLLGTEGMGIYMLIMPTFTLLIGIAQLGLPVAISKLVAEDKSNNKNLIFSTIPIITIVNTIIIIIVLLSSKFIANNLLHEPRSYYALICVSLVLPFISISSIIRGYFFGRQKMFPHVLSNIVEDITRLIILIIGIPIFIVKGLEFAVAFVVLANIVSELISIFILFLFLPKNFNLSKQDIKPQYDNMKNMLAIGFPTTGSRLIGSIGYFFEPIILTFFLLNSGYSNSFIVKEYGILNGYVMPILLLPSFFTLAISQALLPVVAKNYSHGNKEYTKSKIKQAIFFSLIIGIPATLFFLLFPELPLKIIYNTTSGINYLKVLAPICLLYYIQSPLTSSLQAMGKAKCAMQGTLWGMIIRTIVLIIGSVMKIGLYGLVLATASNIIYITVHHIIYVKKYLK